MEFDDLIGGILRREGGYVNHSADRGGATNMGITQRVFSDWLASHGMTYRDVRGLTKDEAAKIYFELYWKNSNCPALPTGIRDIHFDAAVNHGVRRAALLLQAAAGATQDGAIGKNTIKSAFDISQDLLRMRYIVARYRFYGQIVKRDRSQIAFIVGWLDRMAEFS